MDFVAVVDQVIALLRQRGRVTYSTLKRQFQLDEAALEDVKTVRLAADLDYHVIVVEDGCADRDPDVHTLLMEKVFPRQATMVSAAEMVAALGA